MFMKYEKKDSSKIKEVSLTVAILVVYVTGVENSSTVLTNGGSTL